MMIAVDGEGRSSWRRQHKPARDADLFRAMAARNVGLLSRSNRRPLPGMTRRRA